MSETMIAYLISSPIYMCVCMGFTRTDIQITISNMHQRNIVIVLISIVILTHAREQQQQEKRDKPANKPLHIFVGINSHKSRFTCDLVSFLPFFHHLSAKSLPCAVYTNRKIFHKQLQFSSLQNCRL